MADYFSGQIEIGGELNRDALMEFAKCVSDELLIDWERPAELEDILKAVTAEETFEGNNSEASYGQFEAVEAFCQEHGLSYVRKSDAKYEYDAEVAWWKPGMAEPLVVLGTQAGKASITLEELEKFGERGMSIRDIINAFMPPARSLPLSIDPPVTDEWLEEATTAVSP